MNADLRSDGIRTIQVDQLRRNSAPIISWFNLGLAGVFILVGIGLAFISVYWSFALAALIMFSLVAGWFMVHQPEIGLLAVVFVIPFEDFNQPDVLGPFSIAKLIGVAAIAAYAIHYFISGEERKLVNAPQNIYVFLLLAAVIVSDLVAIDPEYAVDKTFKLVRVMAFYFLVINIIRTRASMHRVFWVMIITGLISASYGLYEYYFTPEVLDDLRITGTYDDPLGLAYAMAALLPIVWYLFKHSSKPIARIFLVITGLIFLYSLILTGARSGILIALVVMILIALREKHAVLYIAFVSLIIVFGLLVMPVSVQTRLGLTTGADRSAEASAEASTERRSTYTPYAIQLFLENPIIGSGLGGFAQSYSQSEYRFLRGEDDVRRVAHNMYLEFAVGAGLLGLIPFIMLLVSAMLGLQRAIGEAPSSLYRDMAQTVQASLLTFLLVGFFSSSQYDKPLWLLIGLAVVVPLLIKQEKSQEKGLPA
jgi:O-antigen ligase